MSIQIPAQSILQYLRPRLAGMVDTLREFTVHESPSLEKKPTDRCCKLIANEWRKRGAAVEILPHKLRGDHLRITWTPGGNSRRGRSQLLVLGHYDTVYPSGTLTKMPFRATAAK